MPAGPGLWDSSVGWRSGCWSGPVGSASRSRPRANRRSQAAAVPRGNWPATPTCAGRGASADRRMPESSAMAVAALRAEDDRHGPLPIEQRRDLLARLGDLMVERRERFVASVDADFGGRGREETLLAELLVIREA